MRILLIGRNGQIGWELQSTLAPIGDVVALDRSQLDLTDLAAVASAIRQVAPQVIVNAAAYTDVDAAESQEALARTINALAPATIAESARRLGALLIHYSSDYVFDGSITRSYREDDTVSPLSAYGRTKAEGEQLIAQCGGRHLILRTSWVYGSRGKNFLLTMLRLARECDRLAVVADQLGSPTWSRMIALATATLTKRVAGDDIRETVHVASQGQASWHSFASAIIREGASRGLCPATSVEPITTAEFPAPAPRPPQSVLSTEWLHSRYGLQLGPWMPSLNRCLSDMVR